MPKSKNRKTHKAKLAKYKSNKKKEQESFKKKMIENYIKMQQQAVADKEAHTSTEEVSGPEINVHELNQIEDWEPKTETVIEAESVIDVDVEPIIEPTLSIENIVTDDNNNK